MHRSRGATAARRRSVSEAANAPDAHDKAAGHGPLPIPGNNYTEGGSKSRSVPFPAPRPSPPDDAEALVKRICGGVSSESVDVPDDAYGRISALVDAVATALEAWARRSRATRAWRAYP